MKTVEEKIDEISRQLDLLSQKVSAIVDGNKSMSCSHAFNPPWRDDRTGRLYKNCAACGLRVEI